MPATQTRDAKARPTHSAKRSSAKGDSAKAGAKRTGSANELDIFAAEFAKLVERYEPCQQKRPADWLGRLPNEAFEYYDRGLATFGSDARTPIERRGRLYLMHTALLFMWMSWGKKTARRRFKSTPDKGTRRAASLVTLEYYRRCGVLAHYQPSHWFFEPVPEWSVAIIKNSIDPRRVDPRRVDPSRVDDPEVRGALQDNDTLSCDVQTLAALRNQGAVPSREALSLS